MRTISYETILKLSSYCNFIKLNVSKTILIHKLSGHIVLISSQMEETLNEYSLGKDLSFFLNNHPEDDVLLKSLIVNEFLVESTSEDKKDYFIDCNKILEECDWSFTVNVDRDDDYEAMMKNMRDCTNLVQTFNVRKLKVVFKINHCDCKSFITRYIDLLVSLLKQHGIYFKLFIKASGRISDNCSLEIKKRNIGVGLYWNENAAYNCDVLRKYNNKFLMLGSINSLIEKQALDFCRAKKTDLFISGALDENFSKSKEEIEKIYQICKTNTDILKGFWDFPIENYSNFLYSKSKYNPRVYHNISLFNEGIFLTPDCKNHLTEESLRSYTLDKISHCEECFMQGYCNGKLQAYGINKEICNFSGKVFIHWLKNFVEKAF